MSGLFSSNWSSVIPYVDGPRDISEEELGYANLVDTGTSGPITTGPATGGTSGGGNWTINQAKNDNTIWVVAGVVLVALIVMRGSR